MSDVTLSLTEEGAVLDARRNVLQLRAFHIRGPAESDETAWKLIELRGRRMYCGDDDLGELLSVDLEVTGEPDEGGFVTVQFPL